MNVRTGCDRPVSASDMRIPVLLSLLLWPFLVSGADRPNILWLTAEDHGPHLGCYGDSYALTPNIDAFAERALLYTKASSTAPICAPARTTIISGMYGPALGGQHMRSQTPRPAWLKFYPEFLREAGYYCTNNSKTDYNIASDARTIWDESSKTAHYKNRPEGKPFFAIFNNTITHESKIRNKNPNPQHDPAKAPLPPYHPDTPEVRKDWAQYYDRITQMDTWFGEQLKELEAAGLADDTIVFFYADHGSGMPRGKRYGGWSGLHVPMLVHIPEKFNHLRSPEYRVGGKTDRLVGFVDLAPTALSLAGIQPARFHQGLPFLGKFTAKAPEYSFGFRGRADERPDETRSVTDGRYIYIRNFMPHVPILKGLNYQMQTPTTRVWKELHDAGKLNPVQSFAWTAPRPYEELYDLQSDYHETNNIASAKPDVVARFRKALSSYFDETRDIGLLPESLFHELSRAQGMTPGDFARSDAYDPATLFPLTAPVPSASDLNLNTSDVQTLALQLRAAIPAAAELMKNDQMRGKVDAVLRKNGSAEIQAAAAELLLHHPDTRKEAIASLIVLADPQISDPFVALHAMDALSRLDSLTPAQVQLLRKTNTKPGEGWPKRVAGYPGRLNPTVVKQFSEN